ncbi:MAG: DUF1634 domain-containing protein [Thermoplasmata archaeon]
MTETIPPPSAPPRGPSIPDDAYRRMTAVLRGGLLISLAILAAGLVAYLVAHPGEQSGPAISSNPIVQYLSLAGLGQGLASGTPDAYLALGIFVLVATPILRVATGTYYFHRGHERVVAAVTLAVLVLLLVGVFVIGPLIR